MSSSQSSSSRGSIEEPSACDADACGKRRWLAPLVVALLAAATLPCTVHGWYDPSNDGSIYIACARALNRGEGYEYLGEAFRVRPPGFAVLLAPLLAWRGFDAYALNLFVSLWGVLAVALLFAWARPRTGTAVAAGIAALAWVTPTFQKLSNQTLSDVPGVACVFACLLLERRASAKPSIGRDIALGLAIAAGAYVRTLLVVMLPAVIIARWFAERRNGERSGLFHFARRRALLVSVVAILPLLPWSIRNSRAETGGPAEQTMLSSYWTGMWHADEGDPSSPVRPLGALVDRTWQRTGQVVSTLGTNLETEFGGAPAWPGGAVLLALALCTVCRRRETGDVFFVLTMGILVTYFAFEDRLTLPAWALVLPLAAESLVRVVARFASTRAAHVVVAGCFAVAAIFCAHPHRGWDEIAARDKAWREVTQSFAERLPLDARLASVCGWHYEAFLDRHVYNLGFSMRRAKGYAGAEAVLKRREIDAVLRADLDGSAAGLRPELERRFRVEPVPGGAVYWIRER
ncbi:MAG: glycosyltransferase family 39 protein [Planctomycetes bacterium]|nr:glycosyltransferase family 39 protein [Planctomycetota bacterium]